MRCIFTSIPKKDLILVDRYFQFKDPPEYPMMYLGKYISKFAIPNDGNVVTCWSISADIHVNKSLNFF